ncbi:TIGR02266 family protein [Hyalangium rubrum]|uniref:TIGR02266 family protein n=1 Tax=Hyalangium rubrum TaxID=3103134 RepID=A0ABU5HH14_9BACT|nr:TIGR02266 family protein [Hyalangium sp. s54d21]MDY7232745.1 TIGR02266 family protein [Hyalangium sp. s54d21]
MTRVCSRDVPTFSLAALWNASAIPGHVAGIVEAIDELLPSTQPVEIVVALRENEANLELKLEMSTFPRMEMDRFAWEIKASKGTLVELWRLPKAERDAFRAAAFTGGNIITTTNYWEAASSLKEHLEAITARGLKPILPPTGLPPPNAAAVWAGQAPAAAAGGAQAAAGGDEPLGTDVVDEPLVGVEEAEEEAEPIEPLETVEPEEEVEEAQEELQPPAGPENRRARRFPVQLEMEFRTELDFVREHATNISNGGLFVRTAHRPPIDTIVKVDLRLPNGERLQGEALVVHVVDDPYKGGVGLAFLSDDPTFAETLDRYLASLAG